MAKIDVKGEKQSELYQLLTNVPGVDGHSGDIRWNFEKFKIDSQGKYQDIRHKPAYLMFCELNNHLYHIQ